MNIALNDAAPGEVPVDLPQMPWLWTPGRHAREAWAAWAEQVAPWLAGQGVLIRDTVILLPQVALLNHARQAWVQAVGGWMPRFETVGTLLERLPRHEATGRAEPGALTLDEALDRLQAGARLAAEPGGRRWQARDRAAFDFAAEQIVTVAHGWLKVALAQAPGQREAWVAATRQGWPDVSSTLDAALSSQDAPVSLDAQAVRPLSTGRTERWLVEHALAWAAQSLGPLQARRDPLFACEASAWLAVTAGLTVVPGSDSALMLALLRHARESGLPVCWTPALLDASAGAPAPTERPGLFEAAHGAQEAEAAAALVLEAVAEARARPEAADPVALLAQDRVLTRRVRALLAPHERSGALLMADESGWTLSTTRAAAAVTRLLAAASRQANSDDWLDWLVEGWCEGVPGGLTALGALETWARKGGKLSLQGMASSIPASHPGAAVLSWAEQVLAPLRDLQGRGPFTLAQGLTTMAQALGHAGALHLLKLDEAGRSVLKALRLEVDAMGDVQTQAIWGQVCAQVGMNYGEFQAWVDQTLESANFMPPPPPGVPDLVITPLTRAVLRPFSQVIAPGADERQLGRDPGGQWLPSAQAERMGLGTPDQQQASQWEAWAVLACHPRMIALARRLRDGEPVAPSPWLHRWLHELGALPGDDAWRPLADPRLVRSIQAQGLPRAAPGLLPIGSARQGSDPLAPARISATAYEQLRACPYRYFALSLLGLSSLDELDEGIDASETGTWLHEALRRFHDARDASPRQAHLHQDVALFLQAAAQVAEEVGLSSMARKAYFSPWLVTLPQLAEHYVTWLHGVEQEGWMVHAQEQRMERPVTLDRLPGRTSVLMHGQLDRVDRRMSSEGIEWQVMDYKTGSLKGLQDKVKSPDEDTQLAFYAALADATLASTLPEAHQLGLNALYLRVADDQTQPVEHADAQATAHRLVQGLEGDLSRIWLGQAMPALGEGVVCDYCEARGLCRKDHWAPHEGVHPGEVA